MHGSSFSIVTEIGIDFDGVFVFRDDNHCITYHTYDSERLGDAAFEFISLLGPETASRISSITIRTEDNCLKHHNHK